MADRRALGLSNAAYARHRGALGLPGGTRDAVGKARASARLQRAILADGTLDPALADCEWAANTHPDHGGARPPDGTQLRAERHLLVKAKRHREELLVQRLLGNTIDVHEARRCVATWAVRERMHWEVWPSRIAAEMAAQLGVDEGRLVRVLEERVRENLRALAEEPLPEQAL